MPAVEPVTTQTLSCETEIHRGATVAADDDAPPRTARRDRLEPRRPLAGLGRPAAERHGPRAGARSSPTQLRDDAVRRGLLERPPTRARDGARSSPRRTASRSSPTQACARSTSASWSGLTRAEIDERFPDGERPDGETREEHAGARARGRRADRARASRRADPARHARRHDARDPRTCQRRAVPPGRPNCDVLELHFRDDRLAAPIG